MSTGQWWFVVHELAAGRVSGDLYRNEDRARQRLAELRAGGAHIVRITGQLEAVKSDWHPNPSAADRPPNPKGLSA